MKKMNRLLVNVSRMQRQRFQHEYVGRPAKELLQAAVSSQVEAKDVRLAAQTAASDHCGRSGRMTKADKGR